MTGKIEFNLRLLGGAKGNVTAPGNPQMVDFEKDTLRR